MNKIKVKLNTHASSIGRGIGFYDQHLANALEKFPEFELVDKNPDIIHYTYFDLFYKTLPSKLTHPTVVTVHDVTPLVLPEYYPKGIKGRLNLFRQKLALRNVAAVITDSKNSKNDIVKRLGVPKEKITVTPLAVDPIYQKSPEATFIKKVKRKYHLPEKFVLYVGGINANKNLIALIEATLSLDTPLVLVGSEFTKPTPGNSSFKAKIGLQKNHPELRHAIKVKELISQTPLIHALGFVPSKDLAAIYRLASIYCQPSLYEGFGFPLLEAMTSKCLVVSSNTSSLPEIYPKDTIIFDPTSLPSIKEALTKALNLSPNERKTLINHAYLRSKDFTWDKTAKETLTVYKYISRND